MEEDMKKIIALALSLALLIGVFVPAQVAAKPATDFLATANITGITPGTVSPMGDTGLWNVIDRQITGSISGGITGDYVANYSGVFDLATQAGVFQGTITCGDSVMTITGGTLPLDFTYIPDFGVYLPTLKLGGTWEFVAGGKGGGTFSGYAVFIPDMQTGHVIAIVASNLTLTGEAKIKPDYKT
jgi:hypothetical protein